MESHVDADIMTVETKVSFKLDKNNLHVQSDPMHHGFWELKLERGALPNEFRGRYTKRTQALQAAKAYMERRGQLSKE